MLITGTNSDQSRGKKIDTKINKDIYTKFKFNVTNIKCWSE